MTDLRQAAQQALEALEALQGGCTDSNDGTVEAITVWCPEIIDALKAALAEHFCDTHCTWADHAPGCVRAEPVQEPVAWVLALPDGRLDRLSVVAYDDEAEEMLQRSIAGCTLVPLYAAPPQRKPLTEQEIWDSVQHGVVGGIGLPSKAIAVARAIERAHGIT